MDFYSAFENKAQDRLDAVETQIESIKGVDWETPKEVAEYFPNFNNTAVREKIVRVLKGDPFPGSGKLISLCNTVGYMTVYPDSNEQCSIYDNVKKLFAKDLSGAQAKKQVIYNVLWMLDNWGVVKAGAKSKYLGYLRKQFSNPYLDEILDNWDQFASSQEYCTNYIEENEDNEYNVIVSKDLWEDDKSQGDDLISIREDLVALVKMIREFIPLNLEDPYTIDTIYDSLNETGNGPEEKAWDKKISLLITVAKLVLKF